MAEIPSQADIDDIEERFLAAHAALCDAFAAIENILPEIPIKAIGKTEFVAHVINQSIETLRDIDDSRLVNDRGYRAEVAAAVEWIASERIFSDYVDNIKQQYHELFDPLQKALEQQGVTLPTFESILDYVNLLENKDTTPKPPLQDRAEAIVAHALQQAEQDIQSSEQIKKLTRRAVLFGGSALAAATVAGAGGKRIIDRAAQRSQEPFVFNIAAEATKAIQTEGGTTLTSEQNRIVQDIKSAWKEAGSLDAPATRTFFRKLSDLRKLANDPETQGPVLARLMYFGAHQGPPFKFLADLIASCPEAENVRFTAKADFVSAISDPVFFARHEFKEPETIYELIKSGIQFNDAKTDRLYAIPEGGDEAVSKLIEEIGKAKISVRTLQAPKSHLQK